MLKTMVAFIKKRIKKSTISAINLWAKDGITYSLPANLKKKKKGRKIHHFTWVWEYKPVNERKIKVKVQLNF
jgi:plasmid replication initiation protein